MQAQLKEEMKAAMEAEDPAVPVGLEGGEGGGAAPKTSGEVQVGRTLLLLHTYALYSSCMHTLYTPPPSHTRQARVHTYPCYTPYT